MEVFGCGDRAVKDGVRSVVTPHHIDANPHRLPGSGSLHLQARPHIPTVTASVVWATEAPAVGACDEVDTPQRQMGAAFSFSCR